MERQASDLMDSFVGAGERFRVFRRSSIIQLDRLYGREVRKRVERMYLSRFMKIFIGFLCGLVENDRIGEISICEMLFLTGVNLVTLLNGYRLDCSRLMREFWRGWDEQASLELTGSITRSVYGRLAESDFLFLVDNLRGPEKSREECVREILSLKHGSYEQWRARGMRYAMRVSLKLRWHGRWNPPSCHVSHVNVHLCKYFINCKYM